MTAPHVRGQPPFAAPRRAVLASGGVIVLAALAAYHGSFSGPFVFDDTKSIVENPTIRHLSLAVLKSPPGGLTVTGRPLLNLSLAVNYAISGTNVWSYHALNLLIHILAGLTLFGVVRRTMERSGDPGVSARSTLLGFAVALLWTVHPLQTESVTYVIQRAESLMGLFYLLTIYCFIRGAEAEKFAGNASFLWFGLCWFACFFGMATKEVMVTAPVMVFLYDRTFVSGSFREAWRSRRDLYLSLASPWILLVRLVVGAGGRGGTAGFGVGISWWAYAITQFKAVALYLRLSLWPHPLVVDYGRAIGGSPPELAFDGVIVGILLIATVVSFWRRPALGFIGAWFFLILAPSSSVVPVATEIMAEHRMYLSLAAVLVAAILIVDSLLERVPFLFVCLVAALGLGFMTARRNEVYRSNLALWADTVAKNPNDDFAQNNLGKALFLSGRSADAAVHYAKAIQLDPNDAEAHYNLANIYGDSGRLAEAISEYQQAIRIEPDLYEAHNNLGLVLSKAGRPLEAIDEYQKTLQMTPDSFQAHCNLADALAQVGRLPESVEQYGIALQIQPDAAFVHENLAMALAQMDRVPEAIDNFETAVRIDPNDPDLRYNLGIALRHVGRTAEAEEQFQAATRLSGSK